MTSTTVEVLAPNAITAESVGLKALGLCSLPPSWTPPYFVIDGGLLRSWREAEPHLRSATLEAWLPRIRSAAAAIKIEFGDQILVRSSAPSESIAQRGRLHSTDGAIEKVERAVELCLTKTCDDPDLVDSSVNLIVQKAVIPVSAIGHMSNERRVYEEARDWLGTFEAPGRSGDDSFTVNLREWRKSQPAHTEQVPLSCNLRALVSQVMHVPAWWAHRRGLRLHFEWVWDGKRIYIVQADEAEDVDGVDPTKLFKKRAAADREHQLGCLVAINEDHAARFHKIRNVFTYLQLGLPITRLYVLEDEAVFSRLLERQVPSELEADLKSLVRGSLVIRTDLETDDKEKRQLLPRTNELRSTNEAIEFMRTTLVDLRAAGATEPIAFIFHNFIPASASAFAYAIPGQRKIRIEALWGIPEGLYYNSHDKVEVDTGFWPSPRSAEFPSDLAITKRPRFKRFFVAPNEAGHWVVQSVRAPFDWRLSIPKDEWIARIAWNTRRIAEFEKQSVSVMWFIGVPSEIAPNPVFPWFHEQFEYSPANRPAGSARRKTPFDEQLVVTTKDDIEKMEAESVSVASRIRQIRIQPREEGLFRDKNLLKKIGDLAKRLGAVIHLEGGTLSHAYYQLVQTGAVVEVVHPFAEVDERREFNKLIRDDVPAKIAGGGERVRLSRLEGDALLRALREKLVEESLETLDANRRDSIADELADVAEVMDAILKQIGVSRAELRQKQASKRQKAGAFDKGYVLHETANPAPAHPSDDATGALDFGSEGSEQRLGVQEVPVSAVPRPLMGKWSDKRDLGSASERILKLVVPLLLDTWSAESREIALGESADEVVRARVVGIRDGGSLHLEISVFSPPVQLELPIES